eukprot:IDg23523t1
MLRILPFLTLLPLALAQCGNFSVPIDRAAVGQKEFTSEGCSPGSSRISQSLDIEKWGCALPAARQAAVLLHRPGVDTLYFATAAPAVFKAFQKDFNVVLPCNKIPVQRVMAWGPGRKKFISLVAKAIKGIERIRDFDCNEIRGNPNGSKTKQQLDVVLKRHRNTNAAINYLHGLAYANFFCV